MMIDTLIPRVVRWYTGDALVKPSKNGVSNRGSDSGDSGTDSVGSNSVGSDSALEATELSVASLEASLDESMEESESESEESAEAQAAQPTMPNLFGKENTQQDCAQQ